MYDCNSSYVTKQYEGVHTPQEQTNKRIRWLRIWLSSDGSYCVSWQSWHFPLNWYEMHLYSSVFIHIFALPRYPIYCTLGFFAHNFFHSTSFAPLRVPWVSSSTGVQRCKKVPWTLSPPSDFFHYIQNKAQFIDLSLIKNIFVTICCQNFKYFQGLHQMIRSIWREFWAKLPVSNILAPLLQSIRGRNHFCCQNCLL